MSRGRAARGVAMPINQPLGVRWLWHYAGMTVPRSRFSRPAHLSEYLARRPDAQLVWIGYRIFKWLLLLTVAVMAGLAVYAFLTYPTMAEISDAAPNGISSADLRDLTKDSRADWISNLKDLAQLFLLTPIFPLLAAVIGYIFGRSHLMPPEDKREADPPQ